MLAHVGREGDAGGLEDPADLTGNHGTGSDALAVLFDGGQLARLLRVPYLWSGLW